MRDAIHSTLLRAIIESAEFQRNAAEVISAPGAKALVSATKNSTQLTNFAVKALDTGCGIEGTTSPNNGYKGYLSGPVATGDTEGVYLDHPPMPKLPRQSSPPHSPMRSRAMTPTSATWTTAQIT
ncbi:hypothetical protein ACXM2N_05305 [Corynebacterium sp. ZY180755]